MSEPVNAAGATAEPGQAASSPSRFADRGLNVGGPRALRRALAPVLVGLAILGATGAGAQSTALPWRRWEATLRTTCSYPSAYRVAPRVTYTSPAGAQYVGSGFWDGVETVGSTTYNLFRIRNAFPRPAVAGATDTWSWSTTCPGCSCATGLVTSGTVAVEDPTTPETLPIFANGPIKVRPNAPNANRVFVHANNVPFLWIGDTAWPGLYRSTASTWGAYLTTRASQGFTVIQTSVPIGGGAQPVDSADRPPFCGTYAGGACTACAGSVPDGCGAAHPVFWGELDQRVKQANEAGFVVVVIGLFKRVIEGNSGSASWPSLDEQKTYARYVAARLSGDQVVLSPGFDGLPIPGQVLDEDDPSCLETANNSVNTACRARAIGKTIRDAVPHAATPDGKPLFALLTHHIGGACRNDAFCRADYWLSQFHPEPWLDFQLFQSGQASSDATCRDSGDPLLCPPGTVKTAVQLQLLAQRARERPAHLRTLQAKPNVNGEGIYDSRNETFPYDTLRVRQTGYLSMLSGAAGYTLGVNGTWDWSAPVAGASSTSSIEMSYLARLFREVAWRLLSPEPTSIANQVADASQGEYPPAPPDKCRLVAATGTTPCASQQRKMVYARDVLNGQFGVAYLPDNTRIDLNTSTLGNFVAATWCLRWFSPRAGTYHAVSTPAPLGNGVYRFTRPTTGDWALLLKSPASTCPAAQ